LQSFGVSSEHGSFGLHLRFERFLCGLAMCILVNFLPFDIALLQAANSLGLSIFLDFLIWVVESPLIPHVGR
jgi:hypothetical protein